MNRFILNTKLIRSTLITHEKKNNNHKFHGKDTTDYFLGANLQITLFQ